MPIALLLLLSSTSMRIAASIATDRCEVRSGLDQPELERMQADMASAGMAIADLRVNDGGDGRPRFDIAWSSRVHGPVIAVGAHGPDAFYRASLDPMGKGYRMTGVRVGVVSGSPWFEATFTRGRTRQQSVSYWLGETELRAKLRQPGTIALSISPYRIGRWQYFAALFDQGDAREGRATIGLNAAALARNNERARHDGFVLADASAYGTRHGQRFAAVWRRPEAVLDRRCHPVAPPD